MKKLYPLLLLLMLSTVSFGQLVINEVLYDPGSSADANNDGVFDSKDDEFIELVNSSTTAYLDISGYEIWDDTTKGAMRFEFPNGTILAPRAAVVVFGGGTPNGDSAFRNFGGAIVFADTGSAGLNFNNMGENIVVKDSSGTAVGSFNTDTCNGTPGVSYNRNPDITGPLTKSGWVPFSPGFTYLWNNAFAKELHLKGVFDFTTPDGGVTGKGIHLIADSAISDLSYYGLGVANNGGGSDGIEYTFPAISASAGDQILVLRDSQAMADYLDQCFSIFDIVLVDQGGRIDQNGDDAIEFYIGSNVLETYGDVNVDGTGQPWEYLDAWAYSKDTTINLIKSRIWKTGIPNCTDNSNNIYYTDCKYPGCPNAVLTSVTVSSEGNATEITEDDGTLQMMAMVGPEFAADTTVVWSVNDTNLATINDTGLLMAKDNGTVTVTATATDGGGASGSMDITLSNQSNVSVAEINGRQVRLSPNPAKSTLRVVADVPLDKVTIFNVNGQLVLETEQHIDQIDISRLENGVYVVMVESGDEMVKIRLVKQ